MKFDDNLYASSNIEDKMLKKYIKKIKKHKPLNNIYLLTYIEESLNSMEILSTKELYRTIKRGRKVVIIGIAKGIENAFELTRSIYDDMYQLTKQVTLSNYFEGIR